MWSGTAVDKPVRMGNIMELKEARLLLRDLPKGRTLFEYYRDRYAVELLQGKLAVPASVAQLKKTRFAKLLEKPTVKQIVARKGDGLLSHEDLVYAERQDVFRFVLTIGLWSRHGQDRSWAQTSRGGTNLVLQLNFDKGHDRAYEKLIGPLDESPFPAWCHPVCRKGRMTMAWARLDIDLHVKQALIEEIQNDWVRRVDAGYRRAQKLIAGGWSRDRVFMFRGRSLGRLCDFMNYADNHLYPRAKFWSEAMLTAALWFLREELHISTVWYHTPSTGTLVKKIRYGTPPVSVYSRLPKQFCFDLTDRYPAFVVNGSQKRVKQRLKTGKERFWRLDLH